MRSRPLLTICVPSRNRQRYFTETIRSLVINLRTDIQFVFADNSDDPSIMLDVIKDIVGDPRVVFLPCAQPFYSMQDNWERCIEAANGEWITFIGDDDYVDPDVADLIARIVAKRPEADALSWSRPVYDWPPHDPTAASIIDVRLGDKVFEVPRNMLWRKQFLWEDTKVGMPLCRYSIYHGAISARLLQKIKTSFGGRFFEYPVVDLENNMKVLSLGQTFFYSQRPFSVAGICAESNGRSWGNAKAIKISAEKFKKETPRKFDEEPHLDDFPFPIYLGNTIVFAQTQLWFVTKYNIDITGWEENFARTCADYCACLTEEDDFEEISAEFREGFATWKQGKYLEFFNPREYKPRPPYSRFTGLFAKFSAEEKNNPSLFVSKTIAGVKTCPDFFAAVRDILPRVEQLDLRHLGVSAKPLAKPVTKRVANTKKGGRSR